MEVTALYIYPVKSMSGSAVNEAVLFERGLDHDRRWMWIDENGKFISQREFPQMVLWTVKLVYNELFFQNKNQSSPIVVPAYPSTNNRMNVRVWDDEVSASVIEHPLISKIAEDFLPNARLVYLPEDSKRAVDKRFGQENDHTSFADGYPVLVCNKSSLEKLNEGLEEPISIMHFRPNVVVNGCGAYEEDNWKEIQLGDAKLELVKPCGRCVMININPLTATKNPAVLKVLASSRTAGNKVLFGMNAISRSSEMTIKLGDPVSVLSVKS